MDRTPSALRRQRGQVSHRQRSPGQRSPGQSGDGAPQAQAARRPDRRPARLTQESRSRAARERLLVATIEVLIDRGYNGLTTKEVAARAGFSSGALVHHYRTKAELVIAATAHIYDRCIENG